MLQWMGGSRRKVTASRMSTQKRQKQYFEQRKRQQQLDEHNPSGPESYSDRKAPYTQCHENSRSLDVLSLLNLSKNGQDSTSRFPEAVQGRGSSNDKHTTNYQSPHRPNTIQTETRNLCPSEHVEIRETRITPNHQKERVCQQKFLSDFSSGSPPDASRRNNAVDPVKMTTNCSEMSVLDMLGDDGQSNCSRGKFVHESHVAFSVEGMPITSLCEACNCFDTHICISSMPFSPSGLGKVEMGTPAHSPQRPTRNISYGCRAKSKVFKGSRSSKKLNFSLEDQFPELVDMDFDSDVPINASSFEPLHNTKQKTVGKEYLLHETYDSRSNDECYARRVDQDRFTWPEKSRLVDENFLDDTGGCSSKCWPSDLDPSLVNHMRSRKFDKPDYYFEDLHTQKRRASERAAGSFDFSELSSPYQHQPENHYDFTMPEMTSYRTTRRNSDFSEMAHSSAWPSFATQDARDHSSFFSEDSCLSHAVWREGTKNASFNQKIRVHEADLRSPVNNFNTKKNSFRMSDFSTPEDAWLYEEQYNIENKKSAYVPMTASKTRKSSPFGCKRWTEEPFDSDFNSKYYVDGKLSEHDAFSGHQETFNNLFKEEKDFSKIQYQESISTETNKSATLPATSSTLHQSNYSSSPNGTLMNVVDLEDNHSQFKESKINTPEMNPGPHAAHSPLRSEGGSTSVEMPQKLEGDGLKEHSSGSKTSLVSLNVHKEDSGHGEVNLKHEGPLRKLDQSCKVMMLGRFVLQLM